MGSEFQSPMARTLGRLFGVLAILSAGLAAGYLLLSTLFADVFFAAWILVAVVLAIVGGVATLTDRTPLVWVAAVLLTGLSIVGLWSIGRFIAPAAVFLLGSAVLLQWAGSDGDARAAIIADPPRGQDVVRRSLAGAVSLLLGGGLVYEGAVTGELFGACASETLACAIGKANWGRIGLTTLGLVAIGFGGWMLWKQFYIARVLTSKNTG